MLLVSDLIVPVMRHRTAIVAARWGDTVQEPEQPQLYALF